MSGMTLVFVLALAFFGFWTSQALVREAEAAAVRQVGRAMQDELEAVGTMSLDYAKWDDFVDAVRRQDIPWIAEDVGTTAALGEAFQAAVLWGGSLPEDVGWSDSGTETARSGVLPGSALTRAERAVAAVPLNSFEGRHFFFGLEDGIYAASVARIETVGDETVEVGSSAPADPSLLLLARRIDRDVLARVEAVSEIKGLHLTDRAEPGRASAPLLGADGEVIGQLTWDRPRLDQQLLGAMLPAGLLVALIVAGLSGLGIALVRRSARELVGAERRASHAARTDVMTGLPNRAAFNEVLARPHRAGQRAILFLDVNGFKRINDSIGHAAGDAVIVAVAGRLSNVKAPDCLLARIAGDEFVFVVTGPDARTRTEALARSATEALANPFAILGHSLQVRMAMGYAVQTDEDMTGEDLVRQADLAMYEAKRNPNLGLVAFSAILEQASQDAALLEQGLRRALDRDGEITIAYQPIVDREGRLVRAEALARWISPELGPVPPSRFVTVAEQAGLVAQLGRHLFHLLCDDLKLHPDLHVSLNVSPLELMAPDYVSSLVDELRWRGISPRRIQIELTESVVIDSSGLARERLAELHAAGFSTALDDFGTGYSSIGYLRQMSFDVLKIDRAFVSDAAASSSAASLVSHMIGLAHGLGLKVVCEGVETSQELNVIRDLGSDLAQGYLLDRPMPIQSLAERWLEATRNAVA